MPQSEKKVVYTNQQCVGCNRCITGCPSLGANYATVRNGTFQVLVNNTFCVQCGKCKQECSHSVRQYTDDTTAFFDALKNNKKLALIVSPALYTVYPEETPGILGYLKSLGVTCIYDGAIGGDISALAHIQYMYEHPTEGRISSTCSALTNYVEKHKPELIPTLASVQIPAVCLALYMRDYVGIQEEIAYISPCIAEIGITENFETKSAIRYVITIEHLLEYLKDTDTASYSADFDKHSQDLGYLLSNAGGLKEVVEHYSATQETILPFSDLKSLGEGPESVSSALLSSENSFFVDFMQCEHGCLTGTGLQDRTLTTKNILLTYNRTRNVKIADFKNRRFSNPQEAINQAIKHLSVSGKELQLHDFYRKFTAIGVSEKEITPEELEKAYLSMGKNTPQSRTIDCRHCGYGSCALMAEAIAKGYNHPDNCGSYKKQKAIKVYTTDVSTGLPNKLSMFETGNQLIADKTFTDYTYVLIQTRNLFLYNEWFGYEGTNTVLREFGEIATHYLEDKEKLFFVESGKFVLFLNKAHVKYLVFLLNHLMLPSLSTQGDFTLHFSVRAGIYEPTGAEKDFSDILQCLYATMMQDPNSDVVYYNQDIADKTTTQLMYVQQVPQAIADKEVFVVYQPKVNQCTNTLEGAEALIRWRRNGVIVSPDNFIPICESTGIIQQIDFYVLNQVCSAIDSWLSQGLEPVKVSVNFSKQHFSHLDVAKRIRNIVDNWYIPHELIEIEFTETAYNEDQNMLATTISQLKKDNFSVSIDDFGSGYSSLSLLENLTFDVLKLDKSLIDTLLQNAQSQIVVTNIIKMAKDLQMKTVAEGVETQETATLLKDLNCDMIQGYFYDKPLEQEEFEKRLKNKTYTVSGKSQSE